MFREFDSTGLWQAAPTTTKATGVEEQLKSLVQAISTGRLVVIGVWKSILQRLANEFMTMRRIGMIKALAPSCPPEYTL